MTLVLWRGVSVIARRKTRSDFELVGRISRRFTNSRRTTAISNWAKEAPRQRRTPPPKGGQRLHPRSQLVGLAGEPALDLPRRDLAHDLAVLLDRVGIGQHHPGLAQDLEREDVAVAVLAGVEETPRLARPDCRLHGHRQRWARRHRGRSHSLILP